MKRISRILILCGALILSLLIFYYLKTSATFTVKIEKPIWQIRSIDTVKYSRDLSREKMTDFSFDLVIDQQVKDIKKTGASYVAVGTPYDDEFTPFLKRWVASARRNNLRVWFRGNFSGWEKWFDYEGIDRQTHISKTEKFILGNPDLFADGDIFTPCPECENGGPGDPRKVGDVTEYREFLISEYNISNDAFKKINKRVASGYFSMNYDVAKLVMNPDTTKALGSVVVIDHYVASPMQISSDAKMLAKNSGGKIVLGEFGAPIEDLHGQMTEDEQAIWINRVLESLINTPEVIGVNYWVNVGGSTQIWDNKGNPKKAVDIIIKYYHPTLRP